VLFLRTVSVCRHALLSVLVGFCLPVCVFAAAASAVLQVHARDRHTDGVFGSTSSLLTQLRNASFEPFSDVVINADVNSTAVPVLSTGISSTSTWEQTLAAAASLSVLQQALVGMLRTCAVSSDDADRCVR
jgi:hypothetical protein